MVLKQNSWTTFFAVVGIRDAPVSLIKELAAVSDTAVIQLAIVILRSDIAFVDAQHAIESADRLDGIFLDFGPIRIEEKTQGDDAGDSRSPARNYVRWPSIPAAKIPKQAEAR